MKIPSNSTNVVRGRRLEVRQSIIRAFHRLEDRYVTALAKYDRTSEAWKRIFESNKQPTCNNPGRLRKNWSSWDSCEMEKQSANGSKALVMKGSLLSLLSLSPLLSCSSLALTSPLFMVR